MFRRSWSVAGSMIVCLILVLAGPTLSAQSQSNVDEVIITDITAESRPGEHPLVTAYVSVLDDQNEHISGLGESDFSVKEFTESVSDFSVNTERQGVAVDVLVDISGSMRDRGTPDQSRLEDVQWATERFLSDLGGEDWSSIYTFCEEVDQVQPLEPAEGSDVPTLEIPSDGTELSTCLFEGLYKAIDDLTKDMEERGDRFARAKKAIFVFSDGADSGLEYCGNDLQDVKNLLGARDPRRTISIYAIGVGSEEPGEYRQYQADFGDLKNLADVTDGEFIHYFGEGAQGELTAIFERFLTQGEQYVVQYGTETCGDQVAVHVGVGGKLTDDENPAEVAIEPVEPVIALSGVEEGERISGEVTLSPDIVLEQCPIRRVTYYVNGKQMDTVAQPFEWTWDTSTLPDDLGGEPSAGGVIDGVTIRVEAEDQKGLIGEYSVSNVAVEIADPSIEISRVENPFTRMDLLSIQDPVERHGTWKQRKTCTQIAPRELTVEVDVSHSSGGREVQKVIFRVDGEVVDSLSRLPVQYDLDISSWGCSDLQPGEHNEDEHRLTVIVEDDLGLTARDETYIDSDVYVPGFWQMILGGLRGQLRLWPAWLAVLLVIALAIYVQTVGTQQAMDQVVVGVRKVTEFLGVVSKGTRLVLIEEEEDVRPYALRDVTNLGRDETRTDISFDNPAVSRMHATVVKEDEDFMIYDQGSKNGTYVNGRRLPFKGHAVLENGDLVELGRGGVQLRFEREEEAESDEGDNNS